MSNLPQSFMSPGIFNNPTNAKTPFMLQSSIQQQPPQQQLSATANGSFQLPSTPSRPHTANLVTRPISAALNPLPTTMGLSTAISSSGTTTSFPTASVANPLMTPTTASNSIRGITHATPIATGISSSTSNLRFLLNSGATSIGPSGVVPGLPSVAPQFSANTSPRNRTNPNGPFITSTSNTPKQMLQSTSFSLSGPQLGNLSLPQSSQQGGLRPAYPTTMISQPPKLNSIGSLVTLPQTGTFPLGEAPQMLKQQSFQSQVGPQSIPILQTTQPNAIPIFANFSSTFQQQALQPITKTTTTSVFSSSNNSQPSIASSFTSNSFQQNANNSMIITNNSTQYQQPPQQSYQVHPPPQQHSQNPIDPVESQIFPKARSQPPKKNSRSSHKKTRASARSTLEEEKLLLEQQQQLLEQQQQHEFEEIQHHILSPVVPHDDGYSSFSTHPDFLPATNSNLTTTSSQSGAKTGPGKKKKEPAKKKASVATAHSSSTYQFSKILTTDLYKRLQFMGSDYIFANTSVSGTTPSFYSTDENGVSGMRVRVQPVIHPCSLVYCKLQHEFEQLVCTPEQRAQLVTNLHQPYHHFAFHQAIIRHEAYIRHYEERKTRTVALFLMNAERRRRIAQIKEQHGSDAAADLSARLDAALQQIDTNRANGGASTVDDGLTLQPFVTVSVSTTPNDEDDEEHGIEKVTITGRLIPFDDSTEEVVVRVRKTMLTVHNHDELQEQLQSQQRDNTSNGLSKPPQYLSDEQFYSAPTPFSATVNFTLNGTGGQPTTVQATAINPTLLVQPLQLPFSTPTPSHLHHCISQQCPLRNTQGTLIRFDHHNHDTPIERLLPLLHRASLAPMTNPSICLHDLHNVVSPPLAKADLRRRDINNREHQQDRIDHEAVMNFLTLREHYLSNTANCDKTNKSNLIGCANVFSEVVAQLPPAQQAVISRYTFIIPVYVLIEDILPFDFRQPIVDIHLRALVRAYMIQQTLSQSSVANAADIRGSQVFVSKWLNLSLGNPPAKTNVLELYENEDRMRRWLEKLDPILIPLSCLEIGDSHGRLSIHGALPSYYDELAKEEMANKQRFMANQQRLVQTEVQSSDLQFVQLPSNRGTTTSANASMSERSLINVSSLKGIESNSNFNLEPNDHAKKRKYTQDSVTCQIAASTSTTNANDNHDAIHRMTLETPSSTALSLITEAHKKRKTHHDVETSIPPPISSIPNPPASLAVIIESIPTNSGELSTSMQKNKPPPIPCARPAADSAEMNDNDRSDGLNPLLEDNDGPNTPHRVDTPMMIELHRGKTGHHDNMDEMGGKFGPNRPRIMQGNRPDNRFNKMRNYHNIIHDEENETTLLQYTDSSFDQTHSPVPLDIIAPASNDPGTSTPLQRPLDQRRINNVPNVTFQNTRPSMAAQTTDPVPTLNYILDILAGSTYIIDYSGEIIYNGVIQGDASTDDDPNNNTGPTGTNNNPNNDSITTTSSVLPTSSNVGNTSPPASALNDTASSTGSCSGNVTSLNASTISALTLRTTTFDLSLHDEALTPATALVAGANAAVVDETDNSSGFIHHNSSATGSAEKEIGSTDGNSMTDGSAEEEHPSSPNPNNVSDVNGLVLINTRYQHLREAISAFQSLMMLRQTYGDNISQQYNNNNTDSFCCITSTMPRPLCQAIFRRQEQQTQRELQFVRQTGISHEDFTHHFMDKCVLPSVSQPTLHLLASHSLEDLREHIDNITQERAAQTVAISPFILHINGKMSLLPPDIITFEAGSLIFACVMTSGVCKYSHLDALFDCCVFSIPLINIRQTLTTQQYYAMAHSNSVLSGFADNFLQLIDSKWTSVATSSSEPYLSMHQSTTQALAACSTPRTMMSRAVSTGGPGNNNNNIQDHDSPHLLNLSPSSSHHKASDVNDDMKMDDSFPPTKAPSSPKQ